MRWKEVQERFPKEWVVLEATKAHSKGGNRYIEEIVVIGIYMEIVRKVTPTADKFMVIQ